MPFFAWDGNSVAVNEEVRVEVFPRRRAPIRLTVRVRKIAPRESAAAAGVNRDEMSHRRVDTAFGILNIDPRFVTIEDGEAAPRGDASSILRRSWDGQWLLRRGTRGREGVRQSVAGRILSLSE
jgi:hypothetical protein